MTTPRTPEHERSTGARPAGVTTEQDAAANVQQMFDTIAPTYDRANHLLSAGIDRSWWTRTARLFQPILQHPETVALDLCCGTGDMTMALLKHRPQAPQNRVPHLRDSLIVAKVGEAPQRPSPIESSSQYISPPQSVASQNRVPHLRDSLIVAKVGEAPQRPSPIESSSQYTSPPQSVAPQNRVPHLRDGLIVAKVGEAPQNSVIAPILAIDFSHQMLSLGQKKFANQNVLSIEADALHLPIANASIDLVTSAFGFRNLANYEEGLTEILRVLRPGGQLGILECNQPEGLTGTIYNLYFKSILPKLGGLITGNASAYSYLNASVERFPRPPRMIELLRNAGFANPTWTSYTFGVVGLYHATRP